MSLASALVLFAILAVGLAGNRGTVAGPVTDGPDGGVTMQLREYHVKSGDDIFVTFERSKGDPDEVVLSPALTLSQDGRVLHRLYEGDRPYDEHGYALGFGSSNDLARFELPPLDPGSYRVCNRYSIVQPDAEEADHWQVCADLTVEA